MHKLSEKVAISFDEECRIRVLDNEKFQKTKNLEEECVAFVGSTFRRRRFRSSHCPHDNVRVCALLRVTHEGLAWCPGPLGVQSCRRSTTP